MIQLKRRAACSSSRRTARDGGREQTEAGGGQLRRPNSQAISSSGRGATTQCRARSLQQRAMETASKPKQEAANCVARTARPSQAPGEGQWRSVEARNPQQQPQNQLAA